ncbi:MAG TPA: pyrroline-5-carboxylate reductase [Bacillota bacterium]|nr:pyrroline-5-carboxylate reductase [Bacillota bacterium]
MNLHNHKIGFIGAGAMGSALLTGMIKANLADPSALFVSDASQEHLQDITNRLKVRGCSENIALAEQVDILVLAVKPWVVKELLPELRPVVKPGQLIISIAAGVTIPDLESGLADNVAVIRVMPNTPSQVGEGATAIALGKHVTPEQHNIALAMFGAVGTAVTVQEGLMNSVTGLSGSGPADMFMVLEARSDAGVKAGLPRDISTKLAAQTMLGAAKMVLETGEHPGRLKDMVTTPGGTTIYGVHALEQSGARSAIINAVMAAFQRANEMTGSKG